MDDNSTRARIMKTQYTTRRKALLESHPWNFAISYVEVALIDPTPDDIEMDYDYVFQLPSNCLRVLKTDLTSLDEWEEIEGNRIACSSAELKVKFIKDIDDVTKFKGRFAETLAWDLAADTAKIITGSDSTAEAVKKSYIEYLRESRSFDAQVGLKDRVQSDEWFFSRRY
jgi:hypothetical protein